MADSEIPEYRYFPAKWMKLHGPRTWARLRFIDACKRLNIPEDKWPKFELDGLYVWPPTKFKLEPALKPVFEVPPFDFVSESPTGWRKRAEASFRLHCDEYIEQCLKGVDEMVRRGLFEKIEIVRDKNTPLDLRYEWAARRYCRDEDFKAMSSDEHKADKIRKAVYKVFDDTNIPYNKRK